jgi:hypothetical protein
MNPLSRQTDGNQRNHDGRFGKAISAAADQKPAMNSSCRKARSAIGGQDDVQALRECGRILHGSKGMDIRKLPIDSLKSTRGVYPGVGDGHEYCRGEPAD